MVWRVGVDTGGTFTDVCLYDESDGSVIVGKVSSTPRDPGQAVIDGVSKFLSEQGVGLPDVAYFAHGTTVATNALLQTKGVKTGVVTTDGFRDLLELGRQRRPKLYDLTARKAEPLASRDLRLEVQERVNYLGEIEIPLSDEDVVRAARVLRDANVEAVAVCLLYSYLNSGHEERIKQILQAELPGVFITISSEVLPEFREFERLSTVVINAFIGPVMQGYLSTLRMKLKESGLPVEAKVTQSNGGIMSFDAAEDMPVRTVLSGPSTGVVGAARLSDLSGIPDIITFDMGGTSSDIALVQGAEPSSSTGMTLDGRPVRAPMLDINTVGAGGGSLAWIDEGGHLKVGPQSAGADPGPACYGRGTTEPTVTDANVVLGLLNQESLLAGTMPIDASLSYAAVEALGERLGMSVMETAQGIISVVTANMARAVRVVSVQRGYNPADYALVAFGGAGPLHSARLATELGMSRTIIPQRPGALSALGMLMTDMRADFTKTHIAPLTTQAGAILENTLAELLEKAEEWFQHQGVHPTDREVTVAVDLRYVGQNYELTVTSPGAELTPSWLATVVGTFHEAHHTRYGYSVPDGAVELVAFRVSAIGKVTPVTFPRLPLGSADPSGAKIGSRSIYLPEYGEQRTCPLYERSLLRPGNIVPGPAVIEQYDSTTFVAPGQRARVDEYQAILTDLHGAL